MYYGQYNAEKLEDVLKREGVIDCIPESIPNPKRWPSNIDDLWYPVGFMQAEGINSLGFAKVGNKIGKFGDCQHFCSPGPADMLAIPLLQMILSVDHFYWKN